MKKKDEERVEFGNWCLETCKPGYDSCQYRGNGIDWLELKRKCAVKLGKKKVVKKCRKRSKGASTRNASVPIIQVEQVI